MSLITSVINMEIFSGKPFKVTTTSVYNRSPGFRAALIQNQPITTKIIILSGDIGVTW